MKNTLRTLVLGTSLLAAGAIFAQDAVPTVVMNWRTHEGITANARGGAGHNGKVILPDGNCIKLIDGSKAAGEQVSTLITIDGANINKGCVVDEAGNILIARAFPTGKLNWCDFYLIPADGSEAREITIEAPAYAETWNDENIDKRADLNGRAVGDVMSEDGGVFYLTGAGVKYPIPVWFKEGEQVELEESISEYFDMSMNSTAIAIPRAKTMAEINEDNVKDMFYAYSGGLIWNIYTVEDGEQAMVPKPTEEQMAALPAGWAPQSQNGFELFTLGGKQYVVRMSGNTTWNADWILTDIDGNIIFHSDNSAADGWNNPANGNAGFGCDMVAEYVDDYTVRLYQIYKNSDVNRSFSAMYTVSLPKPERHVYIVGALQGWNPAAPLEFTEGEDGLFTFASNTIGQGGFKLSTTAGADWDAFNAGVMGVEGNVIAAGNTYTLVAGNGADQQIANGDYVLTIDLDAMTLTVTGEEQFIVPELYLRGTMNEWGSNDAYKMSHGELSEAGEVVYTWTGENFDYEFKIGSSDWGFSFGYDGALDNGTYELISGGEGHNMSAKFDKVTFTLTLNKNLAIAPKLVVEGKNNVAIARKPFAYNLSGVLGENGQYVINFKATEAATEGEIVIVDAEGELVMSQPITGIVKGENQVVANLSDLETGAYNWKIRLFGNLDSETAAVAFADPEAYGDDYTVTGGVVSIRDYNADSYGYVVVGKGKAGGYWVYEPDGTFVGHYHQGYSALNATNGSSTTRGDDMHGLAVFADWSDKASGFWVVDPLNPTVDPRNMLMVEGATQASDGTVTYNGVPTGSGSPCVAFWGNGEDTKMFSFDEDIYANTLVRYDLGENTSIVAAPTMVLSEYAGKMINTNIEVEACEQGFFVSQNRADGNAQGVPGLMFFTHDGEFVWQSPDGMMPSWSSGVAISPDGSMIALSGYNGYIEVFNLGFDEFGEPTFDSLYKIEGLLEVTGPNNRNWMQITFDPANNLLIYSRTTRGYAVIVLPGETAALTPARSEYTINYVSSVDGISIENTNAPVEMFNLQGVAVDAENLTPGIYVRRQGNKVSKVVVR